MDERTVPTLWVGFDDVSAAWVNQFVVQHIGDEFFLTFGQVTPPALLGTDEERRQQLEGLSFVPIRTVSKVGLTRHRLDQLIDVLTRHRDQAESGERKD